MVLLGPSHSTEKSAIFDTQKPDSKPPSNLGRHVYFFFWPSKAGSIVNDSLDLFFQAAQWAKSSKNEA